MREGEIERERDLGSKLKQWKGPFYTEKRLQSFSFFPCGEFGNISVCLCVYQREREREGRGLCSVQEVTGNRNKKTNSIFERKPFVKEKVN